MAVAAVVAASIGALAPGRAGADFPSLYPFCTEQVEVFSSLRNGEFDYCKLHLRYVPGSLDCLRIVAVACNGWSPEEGRWVLRQGTDGRAERIVCPPGPPPPSCPSGYPAGPIPRAW